MITEGADGRLFEVTSTGEIVWEYISPFLNDEPPVNNVVYRAARRHGLSGRAESAEKAGVVRG